MPTAIDRRWPSERELKSMPGIFFMSGWSPNGAAEPGVVVEGRRLEEAEVGEDRVEPDGSVALAEHEPVAVEILANYIFFLKIFNFFFYIILFINIK